MFFVDTERPTIRVFRRGEGNSCLLYKFDSDNVKHGNINTPSIAAQKEEMRHNPGNRAIYDNRN